MRTRGVRSAALAVILVASIGSAPSAAMPPNDVRSEAAPIFIADSAGLGLRLNFQNLATGGTVAGVPLNDVGGSRDDEGDPPLVAPNLPAGDLPFSNCNSRNPDVTPFAFAARTVWYSLVADATSAAFAGRNLVTIDSAGSSTRHVISVYETVPGPFDPGAVPILLPNVIACDLGVTGLASQVSFITEPGRTYALMVGLPPLSNATSTLTLSGRVLDVEAPRVAISLAQIPDAAETFSYEVSASDGAQTALTLEQVMRSGAPRPALRQVTPHSCSRAALARGEYCQAGTTLRVRWHNVAGTERGVVNAAYRDLAGNEGRNRLDTPLRDRRPPRFARGYPNVRFASRRRFVVRVACFGGPGEIRIYFGATLRYKKATARGTMTAAPGFVRPRGIYFIRTVCADRSNNVVDSWSFAQVR